MAMSTATPNYHILNPCLKNPTNHINTKSLNQYRYHYPSHHPLIKFSHSKPKPKPRPPNVNTPLTTRYPITTAPQQDLPPNFTPTTGPYKAADVLIETLERKGVAHVFAYPGGASLEIHQALSRSKSIKTILPRHEQGGVLAASGYARASGQPGVCIATSGPGATNLVTGLADAIADSVPVVAITGQVARASLGTNAFQEVPIGDITSPITKHNFLVLDPNNIPEVIQEAFFIAQTGRPGPVLIDIPKDVQQEMIHPNWTPGLIHLPISHTISRLPSPPQFEALERVLEMIYKAQKPILYVGGGCVNASSELRRFVELTGIPVASTLMGLGVFPCDDHEFSLGMLGMHGTMCANYAVNCSDMMLAFGVRFDDRVTGKVEAFASRAKIVHIDIDSSELGKIKQPHIAMHCDIKDALHAINEMLVSKQLRNSNKMIDFSEWRNELKKIKIQHPLSHNNMNTREDDETIQPQYAIGLLDELTNGSAIVTTGVGQHQMFTAQHYKFKSPRQLLTSGGMGTMGYGLPAAIGAAIAKPNTLVVDIDGDGSFIMNIQELATVRAENLPVKIMLLNNQHLGMVEQLEDQFYGGNRGHTFLGNPTNEGVLFPDMVKFAEACEIPGERVWKRSELKTAIKRMVETPGPYLLDVVVPHQVHVLPMIPSGGTFEDIITE